MNKNILLIIILVLAFVLRIVDISSNPPAMYGDELTMVLDVNSILHTGYDQTGKFLPLNFSMGGGRPVGYGYFSIPFVAILGPTALAVRLLSVLSGVGLVLLIFYLGRRLFSKEVGLVAAALLAISPWDISMSRGGFEAHFALFLAVLGIVLFLKSTGREWLLVAAAFCFGLAIHTYSTYKLIIPVFIPLLFWFVNFKHITRNRLPLSLATLVGALAIGLVIYQAVFINSESRFLNLNIFSQSDFQQQLVQKINYDLTTTELPVGLAKLFHNKPGQYLGSLMESYLKNFSLDFLFLHGDKNPRHNMATTGQLYLIEALTIFFGLGYLWRQTNKKIMVFLLGWLGLGPVAAALLLDTHALRGAFILPPLVIISALGIGYIWTVFKSQWSWVRLLVIAGFAIQFLLFAERLYFVSPNQFSNFWSTTAKQAVELALKSQEQFDYVILSSRIDNALFAYEVYGRVDPTKLIEQNKKATNLGGYWFKRFSNIYIGDVATDKITQVIDNLDGSVMYIGTVSEAKNFNRTYDTFYGVDTQPSFVVLKKLSK